MGEAVVFALNGVMYPLLIFYYCYVFLNVTFTSLYLTTADVPYYQFPSPISTTWTDRYHVEWWGLAIDVLMIAPPGLAAHAWMPDRPMEELGRKRRVPTSGIYAIAKITLIGILVLEVIKFVLRIMQLIPWTLSYNGCADQMFCRNENPAKQSPNSVYAIFIVVFVFNFIFIVFTSIYLAYMYMWESRAKFLYNVSWLSQTGVGRMLERAERVGTSWTSVPASQLAYPIPDPLQQAHEQQLLQQQLLQQQLLQQQLMQQQQEQQQQQQQELIPVQSASYGPYSTALPSQILATSNLAPYPLPARLPRKPAKDFSILD